MANEFIIKNGLIVKNITYPTVDGTSGQVITTDGNGNLTFTTIEGGTGSGIENLVEDLTPQLGGTLDVQSNIITTSTLNGSITINPNGTGNVILSGLNYPNADGTSGQILSTDGSGNLSWSSQGNQSLFATIASDSGSVVAGSSTDTLTISGGTDISTTITDNTLTIEYTGTETGEANQNTFSNIAVSGQTTIAADTTTDTLNIVAGSNITITTDATTDTLTINSTATGEANQNAFTNFAVDGQSTVTADSTTDTLTLVAGDNITLTTDATADSVTISSTATGGTIEVTDGTTTVSSASSINFTGATVTDGGSGIANVAISGGSSGGVTVERVKITFDGLDRLDPTTPYENLTSGVVASTLRDNSSTDIISTFTFSGYTLPPANVMYYGYDAVNDKYAMRYVPLDANNVAPGSNVFGSFTTLNLTTTVNNMGGSKKSGLPVTPAHGYIIFTMQG